MKKSKNKIIMCREVVDVNLEMFLLTIKRDLAEHPSHGERAESTRSQMSGLFFLFLSRVFCFDDSAVVRRQVH